MIKKRHSYIFFRTFSKEIFSMVVKTAFYESKGPFWKKNKFLKQNINFQFFRTVSDFFRILNERFSAGLIKLYSTCPQKYLRIFQKQNVNMFTPNLQIRQKKVYILRNRFSFPNIQCDGKEYVRANGNAQIFIGVAFDALKFFDFWRKFDISLGKSKWRPNAFAGFIYWHELFVKEIDWENEKMVVYEKTKTTGRGMHENEMNIQDLFEKQLCRKFIYDNGCLTFEESVKLAESMVGDAKYNLVCDNCEHTARFLKTGRKESLQVENAFWYVFNLLCTNVPKFLRAPAVRSLVFTVAEILVGELVQQLAPHIIDSLLIGAEVIAAIVAYLIIYMFDVRKLKKQLQKPRDKPGQFQRSPNYFEIQIIRGSFGITHRITGCISSRCFCWDRGNIIGLHCEFHRKLDFFCSYGERRFLGGPKKKRKTIFQPF